MVKCHWLWNLEFLINGFFTLPFFTVKATQSEEELCKPYTYVINVDSDELELPDITKEITEIELDNALIDSSASPRFNQETPSLGDSGSSNSSELGKLTECMKTLREKQLKMEQLDQSKQSTSTSTGMDDGTVSKEERKTLKIDLRSHQNKVCDVKRI